MRLFSYCIPVDDGAAPNPYWGVCTLTICKPVIRRVAEIGDWIIATGSKNSPIGDISKKVVYIMEVTGKLTFKKYNDYCMKNLPNKIPDLKSKDYKKKVGDCIYYYSSTGELFQRACVHDKENIVVDIGGKNSLLSSNFYYFGNKPKKLPENLLPIIKEGQGHRSDSNIEYIQEFLEWINTLKGYQNKLNGNPQIKLNFENADEIQNCKKVRCESGRDDEAEFKSGVC